MSTGYDYTQEGTGGLDLENYEIQAIVTESDANEIEQERSRKDPPAGDHEFFVSGFLDKPKAKARNAWYNGQQYSYEVIAIGVRLSMVSDPTASVIDFFDLPPADGGAQTVYKFGTPKNDSKNPGFMFSKFAHFLGRLGFAVEKGKPLPADALKLANWKGRRIVATIESQVQKDPTTGQPKVNPTTGEEYAPRAQVKLFSYRPVGSTVSAMPATAPPASPRPVAPPTPAPAAGMAPPPALPTPAPANASGHASKLAGVL